LAFQSDYIDKIDTKLSTTTTTTLSSPNIREYERFQLEFELLSSQPIYKQVARAIAAQIREGKFRKGDLLPTISAFASFNKISNSTVGRAYELLSKKGITRNNIGKGTVVINVDVAKVCLTSDAMTH
jgi:DNA-binding transcriptional regulator YhcF (GntR family)